MINAYTNSTVIRLFNCYRPPCSNRDPEGLKYISDLCDCIQYLYPINGTVIICGDFNFPNIDWSVDNCIKQSNFSCTGVFLNLFYNNGLKQFVNSPTRLDNLLDLVLCNDANCIMVWILKSPVLSAPATTTLFSSK